MPTRSAPQSRDELVSDFRATNPGPGGSVGWRDRRPELGNSSLGARLEVRNQLLTVDESTGTNLRESLSELFFILGRELGVLRADAEHRNCSSILKISGDVDLAVNDLGGEYLHEDNASTGAIRLVVAAKIPREF